MFSKLAVFVVLVLSSSSVFAAGGTVIFSAASPTAVPTLSGWMLIVLSLLLFAVAVKVSRQKGSSNAGKFFLLLLGVGVLSSGTGGVKLVTDVNAGGAPIIAINTPYIIPENGNRFFSNESGQSLNFNLVADDDPESLCGYEILDLGARFDITTDPLAFPEAAEYSGVVEDQKLIFIRCESVEPIDEDDIGEGTT
jgi:hypothetical protein